MLLLNLIKSSCDRMTDPSRSNNNTNIRRQNKTVLRMKVRFSDVFLASHRINQRQRVDKECKHIHVLGLDRCLAFKLSPLYGLLLVSSFWLSGHLLLAIKFIFEFIWVNVRWNRPTWQPKTATVVQSAISYSGRKAPSLKMQMVCFVFRCPTFEIAQCGPYTSLFCAAKMADACSVCLYKQETSTVESPSYVHRPSAN